MRFTTTLIRESVRYGIYGYPIKVMVWVWDLRLPNQGANMSYDYSKKAVGMRYGLLADGFFFDMIMPNL